MLFQVGAAGRGVGYLPACGPIATDRGERDAGVAFDCFATCRCNRHIKVAAGGANALVFNEGAKGRAGQCGQNGRNGYDYHQFDQGESCLPAGGGGGHDPVAYQQFVPLEDVLLPELVMVSVPQLSLTWLPCGAAAIEKPAGGPASSVMVKV